MIHKVVVTLKECVEQILIYFFSLLPFGNTILFESEGDFSANTYAFYEYLKKNGYFNTKYRAVWLIDNMSNSRDECICVPKFSRYPNIRRLYYLSTSKVYIFDHRNVLRDYKTRKGMQIVNLFHGCGFKTTKGFSGESKSPETALIVTGEFWNEIMAGAVQCNPGVVIPLGYPRNDYFFVNDDNALENWKMDNDLLGFKKILLWMPTFRRSDSVALSEEYYKGDTGLPILERVDDLLELNEILKEKESLMILKVHHLQSDYDTFKKKYSNIIIVKDDDIISSNVQLYQIVTFADVLITDYSSISNDYLLLNRPMIFTMDDYEEYKMSRGFSIDDPARYFPGHHVFDKDELFNAINDVLEGEDPYKEDRERIAPLMHKYLDGNSSKRIAEFIKL